MSLETERKFLVAGDGWRQGVTRRRQLRQAYLIRGGRTSLRVRVDGRDKAILTIKVGENAIVRQEFEYAIPVADAEALLAEREGSIIVKVRHEVTVGDGRWEIDVFEGENAGLVIAEIELASVDQGFERPEWIGEEVTFDRRYYNSELAILPFSAW